MPPTDFPESDLERALLAHLLKYGGARGGLLGAGQRASERRPATEHEIHVLELARLLPVHLLQVPQLLLILFELLLYHAMHLLVRADLASVLVELVF